MSVETLPSGSHRVIWRDENGAKQRQWFPKGQKREAVAFDGEMRMRKLAGTAGLVAAGRQTLADYWDGPFADHLASKAAKTQAVYCQSYEKHVDPRLGNVPLARLGMKRVRHFHADLVRDKVKPSAADKAMSVLSSILGLAETDELVPVNPVPRLRRERP